MKEGISYEQGQERKQVKVGPPAPGKPLPLHPKQTDRWQGRARRGNCEIQKIKGSKKQERGKRMKQLPKRLLIKILYAIMELCRHWLWDLGKEYHLE